MVSDKDIDAIERALAKFRLVTEIGPVASQVDWVEYQAAASPDRIRRLLDERAKALSLLKEVDNWATEAARPGLLGDVSAFLRECGHE